MTGPVERTLHLESSEEMLFQLIDAISTELMPIATAERRDATIDLTRKDGKLASISITVPADTWDLPLLRSMAAAVVKRQTLVFFDGWASVCDRLGRIPWFVPVSQKDVAVAPTWTAPTVAGRPFNPQCDLNAFLCCWIYLPDIHAAVTAAFGSSDMNETDTSTILNPEVHDALAYETYASAVAAWCACFSLPAHTIAAYGDLQSPLRPEITDWLMRLRPSIKTRVESHGERGHACVLEAPRPVLNLMSGALLFLAELIITGMKEHLTMAKTMPDSASRIRSAQSSPHPAMFAIHAEAIAALGFLGTPARADTDQRVPVTMHHYGQSYVTVGGPSPIAADLLEGLRQASAEVERLF